MQHQGSTLNLANNQTSSTAFDRYVEQCEQLMFDTAPETAEERYDELCACASLVRF